MLITVRMLYVAETPNLQPNIIYIEISEFKFMNTINSNPDRPEIINEIYSITVHFCW